MEPLFRLMRGKRALRAGQIGQQCLQLAFDPRRHLAEADMDLLPKVEECFDLDGQGPRRRRRRQLKGGHQARLPRPGPIFYTSSAQSHSGLACLMNRSRPEFPSL